MSDRQLDQYLEQKAEEFEQILYNEDWAQVQPFYKVMENEGAGQYIPEISALMSEENVQDYKKWDEEENGSTATQTDDNS